MTKVLVTGSKGQLGMELKSLDNYFPNFSFFWTDKENLDIENFIEVENFILKNKVEVLINCAAYTNVDKAEEEAELADRINSEAVKSLASIAKKHNLKLIHISTDYVFDGNSITSYIESDKTNPQNIYGLTKLKGEKYLLEINPCNSVIIRTSWLYSEFSANFVKTILKLAAQKKTISVISDQKGSPTYANDLAKVILKLIPLIKNKDVQIYHYANKGECSWFQFAQEIVKLSDEKCIVKPIFASEFKSKAKRPNFSILNTKKIEKEFDIQIPYWQTSLNNCISKIMNR
ncbi:dTDP-4-dehydrorhamnose reductase [Lutibacter sp. B1]|uniref:dTDP-4-dehydrorhamnose reductase n=1 Tax=Lutibacter sp. B1 TaxID=2725996 RepID=UPI001456D6D0|nr:dTDP-4-dehydrorhamnose reductase [Lutibacter sp. B1]NLP59236.1 dTDP-4-dehydrorhamnose reductase [Lutibacter sp. B1]